VRKTAIALERAASVSHSLKTEFFQQNRPDAVVRTTGVKSDFQALKAREGESMIRRVFVLAATCAAAPGAALEGLLSCHRRRDADPVVSAASTGIPPPLTSDADAGHPTDRRRAGMLRIR